MKQPNIKQQVLKQQVTIKKQRTIDNRRTTKNTYQQDTWKRTPHSLLSVATCGLGSSLWLANFASDADRLLVGILPVGSEMSSSHMANSICTVKPGSEKPINRKIINPRNQLKTNHTATRISKPTSSSKMYHRQPQHVAPNESPMWRLLPRGQAIAFLGASGGAQLGQRAARSFSHNGAAVEFRNDDHSRLV